MTQINEEDMLREVYREQRAEARTNGINFPSFEQWKIRHEAVNRIFDAQSKHSVRSFEDMLADQSNMDEQFTRIFGRGMKA